MTGTGGRPQLNFKDVDPVLLKFNNAKTTGQSVELKVDDYSNYFRQPKAGTAGTDKAVGLFTK